MHVSQTIFKWKKSDTKLYKLFHSVCKSSWLCNSKCVVMETPMSDLGSAERNSLLHGIPDWLQVLTFLFLLFLSSSRMLSPFQTYLTLWAPVDCKLPGSSVHGEPSGQNTGVGSLSLLQWIFPTWGLNPGLLLCRWILYQLTHKESPRILEWVAYPFSSGSSLSRNEPGSPQL